jgi:uncharacterized protein (TIGR02147 family)
LILTGKRQLSSDGTEKVIRVFNMNGSQAEYFRNLVAFKKSKANSDKSLIGEKLLQIRVNARTQYLNSSQMSYYLSWQNIAIRECLLLHPEGLTVEKLCISIRPKLRLPDAEASLQELRRLGLAYPNESGAWFGVSGNISSGDKVESSALIKYHLEMMELAKQSLDRFNSSERDVSNVSVSLSLENIEIVRKKIQNLRQEILKLSSEDLSPDKVLQVNFQIFPIAVKGEPS